MSHEIRKAVKLNNEALDQVGGGKLIDGWENAVKQYVDMALQDPARYNMSFDEFWGVAKGITGSVQQFGTSDKDWDQDEAKVREFVRQHWNDFHQR